MGRATARAVLAAALPALALLAPSAAAQGDAVAATHWSFRPLRRVAPPEVAGADGAIDRFIGARLAAAGLRPLPEADRRTLIRRLTFGLTGLPPTPADIDAFVADRSAGAFEALVDRLLASPAYGEHQAQSWLDLARFAETDGFELDQVRKDAWKYRDWVITALNDDMGYDRFVRLQIAADELAPGDADAAVATGFLMAGPDMPDINDQAERRHTKLNEMTSAVGAAFLGLTLGCAQCHDHKFDPITQADFYALRAVFANTVFPTRGKLLPTVVHEPDAPPPQEHVMLRGHFKRPGPAVEPAYLHAVDPDPRAAFRPEPVAGSSGRRAALATWLTRPDHPLATRVVVNRLWQHHFGRGLVATPNDFGRQGRPPSHPDLLDWLATELPRRGFRLKAMHRLLVTSAAYRRAAVPAADPAAWRAGKARDPDDVLLWRRGPLRLRGEAIRDAMLAVSGRLSDRAGGPGVRPPLPADVTRTLLKGQWKVTDDEVDHRRRSVYVFARRNLVFPLFATFDRPGADASCARRVRSTTAPQAMTLLNSEFSLDCARHLAGVALATGTDREAWLAAVYRRALGRAPGDPEREAGLTFLTEQAAMLRRRAAQDAGAPLASAVPMPPGADRFAAAALVGLCLAVFNCNEFLYVD